MANFAELQLAVGYRFAPTDKELIEFLAAKVRGLPIPDPIVQRSLYGQDAAPWSVLNERDPWQTSPDKRKKYVIVITRLLLMNTQAVRTAGCARWLSRRTAQDVKNARGQLIGRKKTFDLIPQMGYESEMTGHGRWTMDEYSLAAANVDITCDLVICRVNKHLPKKNRVEYQATTSDQEAAIQHIMS